MSNHVKPLLFVLLILSLATLACGGSVDRETYYPKTMGWALVLGETTSHALERWHEKFPSCTIHSYKANVDKTHSVSLYIEYSCE